MRFFQSPYLAKGRDVLTVICDRCDMIAGTFADGVPLCPECFAQWYGCPHERNRPMFDPEKTGRFIRFLAHAQKEIDRMNPVLPPFNLVSRCPKCGMEGGGLGYSETWPRRVAVPPPPDPFPVEYHPSTLALGRYPCSLELRVEHLHRTCPRCGFGWAEACPQFLGQSPVPAVPHVRREVMAFALLMERQLAAHDDDRPGWKECSAGYLFRRLQEEIIELQHCIPTDIADRPPARMIGKEAADVANFAMMIADIHGALSPNKEDAS